MAPAGSEQEDLSGVTAERDKVAALEPAKQAAVGVTVATAENRARAQADPGAPLVVPETRVAAAENPARARGALEATRVVRGPRAVVVPAPTPQTLVQVVVSVARAELFASVPRGAIPAEPEDRGRVP
jgi:hypothetical protein